MRLRRLVPLVSGVLALSAACSSFTAEPDGQVADAGSEAAEPDVTSPSPDATTDPDAGTTADGNLLASPGFEDGCGVWAFTDSKTQPYFEQIDTIIHGGAHACRVCATGDGGLFVIRQRVSRAGSAGARVAGNLWVHANGDAGSGLGAPTATVVTSDDASDTLEFSNGAGPRVDGTWNFVSAGLNVTKAFAHVELQFSATAPAAGYCFVVDDAVLTVTDP